MIRKILLISDRSDNSQRAAYTAGELALKLDASVLVVYVMLPVPALLELACEANDPPYGVGSFPGLNGLEQGAEAVLAQTVNVLDRIGVRYTARIERGHPGKRICEVAEGENVDLIVIGRQGVRRATALPVESVSRCAGCSVLVV